MFKWEIFLPLLLVKLSLSIHAKSEPSIKFISPAPAARVWVDEEHPVEVAFQARGIRLPDEGYMLLYINGREIPQRFERAQNAVSLPDLDEGSYTIEVKLFNRQGEFAEVSASSAFLARRYLELMVHEEYPVSAEGPRSDGSLGHLPGLQEWDHSTAADPPGSPAARLRELWERRLGGGEDSAAADAARPKTASGAALPRTPEAGPLSGAAQSVLFVVVVVAAGGTAAERGPSRWRCPAPPSSGVAASPWPLSGFGVEFGQGGASAIDPFRRSSEPALAELVRAAPMLWASTEDVPHSSRLPRQASSKPSRPPRRSPSKMFLQLFRLGGGAAA